MKRFEYSWGNSQVLCPEHEAEKVRPSQNDPNRLVIGSFFVTAVKAAPDAAICTACAREAETVRVASLQREGEGDTCPRCGEPVPFSKRMIGTSLGFQYRCPCGWGYWYLLHSAVETVTFGPSPDERDLFPGGSFERIVMVRRYETNSPPAWASPGKS